MQSVSPYSVELNQIKSHSSFLQNERLSFLIFELDLQSKNLNESYQTAYLKKVKGVLIQIWKNIRPVVQNSPHCRSTFQLGTNSPGVYTIDLAFKEVENGMLWCELYGGYTYKRNYMLTQKLNMIEMLMRSVLQYFSYFFRLEFKQKPDVTDAAISLKADADKLTMEELKGIVGPNNTIDFGNMNQGNDMQKEPEIGEELAESMGEDDE